MPSALEFPTLHLLDRHLKPINSALTIVERSDRFGFEAPINTDLPSNLTIMLHKRLLKPPVETLSKWET